MNLVNHGKINWSPPIFTWPEYTMDISVALVNNYAVFSRHKFVFSWKSWNFDRVNHDGVNVYRSICPKVTKFTPLITIFSQTDTISSNPPTFIVIIFEFIFYQNVLWFMGSWTMVHRVDKLTSQNFLGSFFTKIYFLKFKGQFHFNSN